MRLQSMACASNDDVKCLRATPVLERSPRSTDTAPCRRIKGQCQPALILIMCCLQVIGVWGDIGHTPNSTDTRNHLLTNNPEIVYNTADFVYAGA